MKVERNGKEFELTKDELFLAHKEYVTSSMQHVLENDFKIPAKYSALIAKEAFHMYHEGGHEEHLSIELAAGNYHTLTHEPTVKFCQQKVQSLIRDVKCRYMKQILDLKMSINSHMNFMAIVLMIKPNFN